MEFETVIQSSRHFEIWRYSVSHAQLLLTSVKRSGQDSDKRIEILFKNVAAMNIPTSFDGISIIRQEPDIGGISDHITSFLKGRHFYRISTTAFDGWIIAGSATTSENNGDYSDPSMLLASQSL